MGGTNFYNIAVAVTANTGSFRTQMLTAATAVDKLSGSIANYQKLAVGIGATALAVGLFKAIKATTDLERGMRNVNSLLKVSTIDFDRMTQSVIELSKEVPQTANVLADAYYEIASAGFEGAEAQEVLRQSAFAASAGMTTANVAVKAISATLNAYRDIGYEASYVSDVLFQTVNLGIITFEELALQLGDVVALAAAAGLGIDEVGSAMATMTLAGLQASEASTSLNRVIQSLLRPHHELRVVLESLGYESGAAALEQQGLMATMFALSETVDGSTASMLRLFPEIRAARGAFSLLAAEGANYLRVASQIESQELVAGATLAAYNEQLRSTSAQYALLKNQTTALGITIGQAFLPALKGAVAGFSSIVGHGEKVYKFFQNNRELVAALAATYVLKFIPSLIMAAKSMAAIAANNSIITTLRLMNLYFNAAGGGARGMGAAVGALGASITPAAVAMGALGVGFVAVAAGMAAARKHMSDVRLELDALTGTSEDTFNNIDRIITLIQDQASDLGWRRHFVFGNEDTAATRALADEFERIAAVNPAAAIDMFERLVALGDIELNDNGDYVGTGDSAVKGLFATESAVIAVTEQLERQRTAALDGTRAFGDMGSTGYAMAVDLADGLQIPIDQFIEIIENAEEFEQKVIEAFTAARSLMDFQPGQMFTGDGPSSLLEQLEANANTAQQAVMDAEDAVMQLAYRQEEAAYGLADASRELQDAQNDIGRTAEDNAQRVSDAHQRVADSHRSLDKAHARAAEAQRDLNDAREEAVERIDDLRESLKSQADDEQSGVLAVARARAEMARAAFGGNAVEQREAAIALREAERALDDTRETGAETREELAHLAQVGVEGSDEVIAARERLRDAEEGVASAARGVAEAQRAAARVVLDNADAMESAYRRVESAQRAVEKAQRDSAALAASGAGLDEGLAAAVTVYEEAVARLNDPARALRQYLEETQAAEEEFLTGIQALMEDNLDPTIIRDLLLAGPEEAGPLVQAMLSDNVGNLIEIQNEHVRRGEEVAEQAAELARLTAFAQEDIIRETGFRLADAWRVTQENSRLGAGATAAAIARGLGEQIPVVEGIINAYGILLTDSINQSARMVGAEEQTWENITAPMRNATSGTTSGGTFGPFTPRFAVGGQVQGSSPHDRADNIPAWLTANEFVQPVDSVRHYGVDFMESVRTKRFPKDAAAFAEGGIVQVGRAIQALGARVTEHPMFGGVAPRPGHSQNSHHYRNLSGTGGDALDINFGPGGENDTEKAFMDRVLVPWVRQNVSGYNEFLWRTRGHHNHAHIGGGLMNLSPGFGGPLAPLGSASVSTLAANLPGLPAVPNGLMGERAGGALAKMREHAMAYLAGTNYFGAPGSEGVEAMFAMPAGTVDTAAMGLPSNVTRWAGTVEQALGVMGFPTNQQIMRSTLRRMNQESGGNPSIVNNWDSNAQRGTPSVGLMQVIGPTYDAYKHPQHDEGPYLHGTSTNPISNILASMRYAVSRYGNLMNAYDRPGGYASGGLVRKLYDTGGVLYPGTTMVQNNTGAPEVVFPIADLATHMHNLIVEIQRLEELQRAQQDTHYGRGSGNNHFGRADTDYGEIVTGLITTLTDAGNELGEMVIQALNAGASLEMVAAGMDALASVTTSAGEAMGLVAGITSGVSEDSGVTGAIAGTVLGGGSSSAEIQAAIDAVEALQDAWDAAAQDAAITAQRNALWDEIAAQEAVLAAAQEAYGNASDDAERAVLADVLAEAQEDLNDAINETIEFDREVARTAEMAAIAIQEQQLQQELARAQEREALEASIVENRAAWEFSHMTTDQQIADLERRMAMERRFTDEWMDLAQQREALMQREADQLSSAADRAADELNRALDQYDQLMERRAQAQSAYDERVIQEVARYEQQLATLRTNAQNEMDAIRKDRAEFLRDIFDISRKFEPEWGNTALAITDNILSQNNVLEQWAAGLDELRARGFSEELIEALGLNDPSNVGQVTMLLGATQQELDAMNAAFIQRLEFSNTRAEREQEELLGAVGRASIAVQDALNEAIMELYNEHMDALDDLQEDLTDQLRQIDEEIAAIGQDTGRSYAEAMRAALATGLPAVIALAREYEQALQAANNAAAGVQNAGTGNPSGGSSNHPPVKQSDGQANAANTARLYDTGGVFPSGTYGVNRSGRDEYVLTNEQWRILAAAAPTMGGGGGNMTISIMMDGREIAQAVTTYQRGANRRIMLNSGRAMGGVR